MGKTKHYRATINLLRPYFEKRPADFKIRIADGYIYKEGNNYFYNDGKKSTGLEQLTEETGLAVFIYTEENRFLLEEFVIAENRTEENEWEFGPYNVTTEDNETIGAVGVINDEKSGMSMVVYLSSEGTVSPITLWNKGDAEEKNLAIEDLKNLVVVINNLITNLADDKKD